MICYRDMTFCGSDCTNTECERYLSAEEAQRADDKGLAIALTDFRPTCPKYQPPPKAA